RLSKQEKEIPHTAVEKLTPLLYREEYEIRENAIWTLKYIVDNKQEVKLKIIDQIDGCLNDSQFGIRNPAAMIFINYWTKQMKDNHENCIGLLSVRIENFLSIIFRQAFSLNTQQSSLDLLQIMIIKDFVLSETLFHLLECCLYDPEQTISTKSVGILRIYSKRHQLPSATLICLEHLLTTETPILNEVILILKSVVSNGYRLSRKAIDILAQLLFKSSEPKQIIILLTHTDRNQPLPKSIDELLRQMYYGQILKHSTCSTSLNKATEELLRLTSKGKLLSNFVLNLIIDQLKLIERRTSLIPILVKAASNGQNLNKDHHRLTLETIFFEMFNQPSVDLMEIFTHLIRQNQIITDRIIEKLENYLYEPLINYFVIEIYRHLVERQKPLSPNLVKTIFEFFHPQQWNNISDRLKHQVILFYKAIADNRPKEANQNYLPFLLNDRQSIYFRKEICISIRLLVEHHEKLHSKTIDCLINLIHDDNDADLQQIALEILNYIRSTDKDAKQDLSKFLDLFQLNEQTDDITLLQYLKDNPSSINNLSDNLSIRLSHMLYSCDLQVKTNAALILAKTIPKGKTLSQQILQVIFWTLMDDTINRETLPILLNQNFEQSLPSSTIDDLIHLANHSSDQSIQKYAKEILHQQIKSNPVKIELFFEYLQSKNNIDEKNFRQTIKLIRTIIIIDKQLSTEKVSFLNDHFFDEEQNEIIDILFLAHRYNISFHQHSQLIKSVEIALQTHPSQKLFELLEIIVENRVILQEKTLATLFDQIVQDENYHALIVLENVSRYQIIPEKMLMYFIDLISNRSNEIFIAPGFSIIRQQISQGFITDSKNILKRIQFPSIIDITQLKKLDSIQERLGTIETLLFITYSHIDIFQQPVQQWSRNCLCFEIISTCSEVTNDQIISFYQNLTQLELWKNYGIFDERRDIFLRHLINKQRIQSLSLPTINEILIYAKTSTDRPLIIIKSNETDWLIKMRSCYIEDQLIEQFRELQYDPSLITHLVQRLTEQQQISAIFISLCLQLMRSVDDILTILELFNTYSVTSADLIEIFFQGESPTNFDTLQKKIQLLIVGKTLISHWTGSNKNLSKARILLQRLIEHKWPVSKLLSILTTRVEIKLSADASESLINLVDVLKILVDYNVDSNISSHLQTLLRENEIKCWPSMIYNRVIEHHFGSSSSEKNLNTLLNELHTMNPQIDEETLLKKYQTIESKYKANSNIISCTEPIQSWSKSTIEDWAKHVRQSDTSSQSTLFEMIAVMKRAVYLDSNFEPRLIQILAILILLDTRDQGGRLLQILTGEGKSTVVSILAAIKALQKQHVDIITSSITLAKRDAHERKSFYNYFNITVAHNNDETSYTSGPKQCYHADVVYGNSSQFQFDLLRHEFSLLNTRALNKKENLSRRFDAVIIDEVDSMLIDENNTLARLADQLPGMEWLNPLLFGIWRAIDVEVEPESKRDTIIDNIRKLLSDPDSDLKIPTHLTQFVHESIATWVDHAILAKVEYRLDHHYIIKPDETRTKRIMPIDFSNTGVVQPSTTWSDGLHQFLQIKHGLKMTTLTVTTNYLSNIGLFTRYGKNIFGLTGTIGSHDARDLLDRIYHVDTIIIPPFKQKRHIQLQTILTGNDDEWLQTIVSETIDNARKQRGILVICETRLDAKTISKQLQRADPTCLVRLYTDNTDAVESNVVGNQIQASEIIVATNLAGRGTDLKTSSIVEQNGGLHVCLTFLPNNLRVEEQAFGRTSRQGQRGTSQMILSRDRTFQQLMINYPQYQNDHNKSFTDPLNLFRDWREQAERIHLERIWRDEIVDIKLKDELFQHFCKLLDQLRQENDNVYRLLSMKEQWGLWLKSMDYITQSRLNLRLFLERQGLKKDVSEDVPEDGHSFFHAIERQLDNKLTNEQIKDQVIEHMITHPEGYSNITEEERHQATSEALKINLIIYRTDSRSPHIYQSEDALHTCLIGYEVGSYYFSVRSDDTDDVISATEKPEQHQQSRTQKLFGQFKRASGTTKLFDQLKRAAGPTKLFDQFKRASGTAKLSDQSKRVADTTKLSDQFQRATGTTKLFDQFKRVADTTKRFLDQAEEQKQYFDEKLSTKIIDHDLKAGLAKFREKMIIEYKKEDFIQNPCYLLMEADTMFNQLSTWSNAARSWFEVLPWTEKRALNYTDVIDRLKKAIELDPIFTFAAKVTLAHFLIDKKQESMELYKINAKSYLVQAQEILGRYILPQLHSMQLETQKSNNELVFGDLIDQTQLKVEILQVYQNYLGQAIRTIEDSQKLTDMIIINKDNCNEMTIKKKLYRDEVRTILNESTGTISLAFHSLKCHQDLWKHDQALNLLNILPEENEKVSIRFLNGSKIKIEELKKIITSCNIRLNIEYLDSNEVQSLIKLFSKTIDLKLTATTDDYLKLIQTLNEGVTLVNNDCEKKQKKTNKKDRQKAEMDKTLVLITNEQQLSMTTDQALKFLQDNGSSIESILFKSIEIEQVDFMISTVTKPCFTLTYHSLTIEDLAKMTENVHKPFNYELRNLSKEEAKKLIEKTTDRSFLLIIEDLSIKHAKKINEDFKRNEQDVKSNTKRLTEHFTKSEQLYEELNAYGLLGINLLISIDELDPRPWISATVVVFLGAGQIAGGICLAALTGGLAVNLGISMIGEGVNDIIFGVRGAISRRFSWKDYAIQKGVSLAICFASLGFSAVVQATKGAQAVGVAGATSVIEATSQGTVAIFKNSFRTVGEGAVKGISSSSWLLAFKQVAVTCAETGARELANYFSESAYQSILSQVKSKIREEIETAVKTSQDDEHYQRIVHRALAIDRYYENDERQNQIEQIAMNILMKNKNQFIETVQSLSKGITNAFLNHSRQLASQSGTASGCIQTAQLLITVGPILKGANEIRTLTNSFFIQYKNELHLLEVKMPSIADLLIHASNQEFSNSTTKDIVQVLSDEKILNTEGFLDARFFQIQNKIKVDYSNPASYLESPSESGQTSEDKLLNRLCHIKFQEDQHRCCAKKVLIKMVGVQNHRSSRANVFQKRIVDMLTDQVCAIIYGTMVTPMTNYVISRAIASLSTTIQLKLDPNGTVTEQLMEQGAKRYIHGAVNDLVDQYHKGELQFDPNAKEKLDQLEERCQKEGEKPATMNEELALNVKNGKQGSVIELCAMAILTKKPITVLQQEMSGEVNNNDGTIKMVYTPPKRDAESGKIIDGHYESVGGTTAIGGTDDCMYTAILSKAQGQFSSVQEMRTQCAAFILTNPSFISGIHPALSIINQTRNPLRWKELMGEGGRTQGKLNPAQIAIIEQLRKKAKNSDVKISDKNNLEDQSTQVLKDFDKIYTELNDIDKVKDLRPFLRETEDKYQGRSQNRRALSGLHALHGDLEGFFTVDAKAQHQPGPIKPEHQSPGRVRYLFRWEETKKANIQMKFMGVADNHGDNVQAWRSIPKENQNNYFCVKNRDGLEFGVSKVSTRSNK
ncbi:unnamed protein product, partial [Adineta steineri]